MGRHSRRGASRPTTEPSRWGGLRQRTHHDDSLDKAAPGDTGDRNDPIGVPPPSGPPAADTGLLPAVTEVRRTGNTGSTPAGDVLTRPADQTQIIPRLPAASTSAWPGILAGPAKTAAPPTPAGSSGPSASDATAVFARPVLDRVAADGALAAEPASAPLAALDDSPLWGEDFDDAEAASPTSHQPWMWPALVVFWLLALGAGIITLASLGAPHYLCTGAAKGLACHRAGTAIAAVLTVAVIAAVGVVSVFAIEARRRGLVWLRYLGVGVVVLAVVAGGGYLLIRTIGG